MVHTLALVRYIFDTRFFFNKNNEAQIWPKSKNKLRTIEAGTWNHKCKVYFS